MSSSQICTPSHAIYAFEVLLAHFEHREPSTPPFPDPNEPFALFVTWNTHRPSNPSRKELRGCIGNFSPMPLAKGLEEYALISALQDHRFSPITKAELPNLSCGISLLTPFQPIPTPLSWTIAQHGIHLTFSPPSSSSRETYSATYLPEICSEQGWTKEECILSAVRKSGYRGKVEVGDEVWKSLKVKTYESFKADIDWEGYLRWREGQNGDSEHVAGGI